MPTSPREPFRMHDGGDFAPPHCPNPDCPMHDVPRRGFCVRHGSYRPLCRDHAVPRFRCTTCGVTFSSQTFRIDFRDHKPELNGPVLERLFRGQGLRRTARELSITPRNLRRKIDKLRSELRARAGHDLGGALAELGL
jgi:transposase-like protein